MDYKIDAVCKMQDYIASHYDENITLFDLSKVSLYSPWHSHRIFKELTNITPADYIRRYKLSKSALELRDNKCRIIEIALKYGFFSQEGYQRAFYKEFKTNPFEFAKNPTPICLFFPYKVIEKKERKTMENAKHIFITKILKPRRKVIIKRGIKATEYFEYCNEVGCDVWGTLMSIKGIGEEPVCMWLPKKYVKENTSTYVQGVEVELTYKGKLPDGYDLIELPEQTYLMFQGEPFLEENFESAILDLWEAMKKYDPRPLGYIIDKENPRIQLEPIGSRGYIELLPVSKIK